MNREKEKLYRKLNTRTRMGGRHTLKISSSYDRNTKKGVKRSMSSRGKSLDFSPLYKFLISNVGNPWEEVKKEAYSRLDEHREYVENMVYTDPIDIENLVSYRSKHNRLMGYMIAGENSYWSILVVDENGILQKMNPELTVEQFYPSCACCTHTFNGKPFINKFTPGHYS